MCERIQTLPKLAEIDRLEGRWQLIHCWTDVRRRFVKRFESDASPISEEMLRQIAFLQRVEASARGEVPEIGVAARRAHAAPILEKLTHCYEVPLPKVSTKLQLATGIAYTLGLGLGLGLWTGLIRFLEDERLELDTNPAGNFIRLIALTGKNALFADNDAGAKNLAVLASLVAICKLKDVDSFNNIQQILRATIYGQPKNQIEQLMPWIVTYPSSLAA